jgi:hypothetical protein
MNVLIGYGMNTSGRLNGKPVGEDTGHVAYYLNIRAEVREAKVEGTGVAATPDHITE